MVSLCWTGQAHERESVTAGEPADKGPTHLFSFVSPPKQKNVSSSAAALSI